MRKTTLFLVLTFMIVALFVVGAVAQEKKPEGTKPAPSKSPKGTVEVGDEILVGFVDEPSHHFDLARENFLKKNYQAAADQMMLGASFIKLEMARATGDDARMLADAVEDVAILAAQVRSGSVTSVSKLDDTFARAEQMLAYHHELMARQYWKEDNQRKAGQDLKAATRHLEHSMKFGGREAEAQSDSVIADARDLGEKLTKGTALAADKVGKAMQRLGEKIEELGKSMWPPKK
jgi:hypothetical protein